MSDDYQHLGRASTDRLYSHNAMQARRRVFYRQVWVWVGVSGLFAAYVVMAFIEEVTK